MVYEIDQSLWWNRPVWDLANRTESRIRAAIARDITYPGSRSVSVTHRSDGVSIEFLCKYEVKKVAYRTHHFVDSVQYYSSSLVISIVLLNEQ